MTELRAAEQLAELKAGVVVVMKMELVEELMTELLAGQLTELLAGQLTQPDEEMEVLEETSDGGEMKACSSSSESIAARNEAGKWWSEQDVKGEEFCGSSLEMPFLSGGRCCCVAGSSLLCCCVDRRDWTRSASSWACSVSQAHCSSLTRPVTSGGW